MIECMIANGMPITLYFFKHRWVFAYVFTYAKEGCPRIEFLQCLQYKLSWPGHGAIIKREKYFFLLRDYSPDQFRIELG